MTKDDNKKSGSPVLFHQRGMIVKDLPENLRDDLEMVIRMRGQETGNYAFAAVLSLAASGASLGAIRIVIGSEVVVGVAVKQGA